MADLTRRDAHFEFGENWLEYSKTITEEKIATACRTVSRLIPDMSGKSVIDIGSGSGLFSLAALRLGASAVVAVDLDENSVMATRTLLSEKASSLNWNVQKKSVFDLSQESMGFFDVVYSWGVLHHTGDMWRAIRNAASLSRPGGVFALAIYRKTPLCSFWKIEKAIYAKSPKFIQAAIRSSYRGAFTAGLILTGRNPIEYYRNYTPRGMNFSNDIHDWLGGYPYESAASEEVEDFLIGQGFKLIRSFPVKVNAAGALGVGCSEFVFTRRDVC